MIEAEDFVVAAGQRGFRWYTGVPCSFLTPFINYVINDDALTYISSANEGDAVATACGVATAAGKAVVMMQNSGLGNAVSPLTSLAHVFRIPVLIVCTHRGAPGVQDEPQHALMGRITGSLFDTMQIPWETFPIEARDIAAVLDRAEDHMARERRPYALIMRQGTVAPNVLRKGFAGRPSVRDNIPRQFVANRRVSRNEVLRRLIELTPEADTVVIATTGYTGRELYALSDRANQFYMVGSMGCASSFALGLSMARPDRRIVVVDGDGAALMRMGNFATLGAYAGDNLLHLVLDNEAHDSTGAQATVSGSVSFAGIAAACGYGATMEGDDPALLDVLFAPGDGSRPKFGSLKIRTGTIAALPRPAIGPEQVLRRLAQHLGERQTAADVTARLPETYT